MNRYALARRTDPPLGFRRASRLALLACLFCGAAAGPGFGAAGEDLSRPDAGGPPTQVQIGLHLVDLYEVSGPDQTFQADVVIRSQWRDSRLAGRWKGLHSLALDDVWHPRLQLVNQRGVTAALPQRVEVDPSGLVQYRQRWWGRFSARLDLKEFPLDRQRLYIQVVSLGYRREEVDLVANAAELKSGRAEALAITDWAVGPARLERADYAPGPGARPLAGVRLGWEAKRFVAYYAVQVILPLVFIVLMVWTAVWVDPAVVATRMSVSMTTMLTLIAYRFALGKSVPNLTYLTRFDYFMMASTVLIFLMLLLVAAGARLAGQGKAPLVHRIDLWTRVVFPVVFGVVFCLAWWG